MRKPHGASDADLALNPIGQSNKHCRRRRAVQGSRAGKINEGFVERERFHGGSKLLHELPYRFRCFGIRLHSWLDDHCVGAQPECLEHRHRGPDAVYPCNVACGGNHSASSAADNDRPVSDFRPVAFFNRRIESIAVQVSDRQVAQFRMVNHSGRTAICASAAAVKFALAVPAYGRHRTYWLAFGSIQCLEFYQMARATRNSADDFLRVQCA